MRRPIVLAILATAILAVAACGTPDAVSPSPASAPPSGAPTDAPTAPASEAPASPTAPPATPSTPAPSVAPSPAQPTAEEQALIDGVADSVRDCAPVREGLPTGAIAGIECRSTNAAVARIGFYRFADEAGMLAAYKDRMAAEGVALDSGSCRDGEGEGAYIPGEEEIVYRTGCFVNAEGYANFRATLFGNVYLGILGNSDDMIALEDYAWMGSQDTPGSPMLWSDSGT